MFRNQFFSNRNFNNFQSKLIKNVTVIVSVIIIFGLFIFSGLPEDEKENIPSTKKPLFSPSDIPKEIFFAGNSVPVSNFDVSESLDRELLVCKFFHSQTILQMKRANRYFPLIEKILNENNIPNDFKYIALIESNLSNVTSPANAVGYWQFLKATGKEFGLEISSQIDERYNIEESTKAACRYFQKSYETFNNWTLVAASYNVGIKRLKSELVRQKCGTYFDLLLNEETARYIYRILAIKSILENPAEFGFQISKNDLYKEFEIKKVEIDSSVTHFADFAAHFNLNYKILKYFNPWLRDHKLHNPNNKKYEISIPIGLERNYNDEVFSESE